mmetsp:Transcript_93901/g.214721  ORF Transcript_93901/g.214721 Transcript_93901/m.214721 type:complete len:305 (+) Transcript_93901:253-1167(+)
MVWSGVSLSGSLNVSSTLLQMVASADTGAAGGSDSSLAGGRLSSIRSSHRLSTRVSSGTASAMGCTNVAPRGSSTGIWMAPVRSKGSGRMGISSGASSAGGALWVRYWGGRACWISTGRAERIWLTSPRTSSPPGNWSNTRSSTARRLSTSPASFWGPRFAFAAGSAETPSLLDGRDASRIQRAGDPTATGLGRFTSSGTTCWACWASWTAGEMGAASVLPLELSRGGRLPARPLEGLGAEPPFLENSTSTRHPPREESDPCLRFRAFISSKCCRRASASCSFLCLSCSSLLASAAARPPSPPL